MISNEFGFYLIDIPFSGTQLFKEAFLETNRDIDFSDVLSEKCIEYHKLTIVKNPYLRAAYIYKNGMMLRKEHELKSQPFTSYFENNLNNWDTLECDRIYTQYSYLKKIDNVDIFKYEELLESWADLNIYLGEIGFNSLRYYTEPEFKDWKSYYKDESSLEIVEYIFEDDFEKLGYTKL